MAPISTMRLANHSGTREMHSPSCSSVYCPPNCASFASQSRMIRHGKSYPFMSTSWFSYTMLAAYLLYVLVFAMSRRAITASCQLENTMKHPLPVWSGPGRVWSITGKKGLGQRAMRHRSLAVFFCQLDTTRSGATGETLRRSNSFVTSPWNSSPLDTECGTLMVLPAQSSSSRPILNCLSQSGRLSHQSIVMSCRCLSMASMQRRACVAMQVGPKDVARSPRTYTRPIPGLPRPPQAPPDPLGAKLRGK